MVYFDRWREISARPSGRHEAAHQHGYETRPTLATKTATAPAVLRSLEGNGQSMSTPSSIFVFVAGWPRFFQFYSIFQLLRSRQSSPLKAATPVLTR